MRRMIGYRSRYTKLKNYTQKRTFHVYFCLIKCLVDRQLTFFCFLTVEIVQESNVFI